MTFEKERLLLTFDPKALHHILVKDQYIYEESTGFVTFVPHAIQLSKPHSYLQAK
jgi:hypothetical protein